MTMIIAGQDYADRSTYQKQLQVFRQMTGEQRLAIAMEMWRTACNVTRAGIRAQHPEFTAAQVDREIARRIMIANGATRIITAYHRDS
jgi:hypothetical protein